jgi:hypothetical protein
MLTDCFQTRETRTAKEQHRQAQGTKMVQELLQEALPQIGLGQKLL